MLTAVSSLILNSSLNFAAELRCTAVTVRSMLMAGMTVIAGSPFVSAEKGRGFAFHAAIEV